MFSEQVDQMDLAREAALLAVEALSPSTQSIILSLDYGDLSSHKNGGRSLKMHVGRELSCDA
jgi:hypothetical protein